MLKVRMSRAGTKKVPFYRVVVTDHRNPRDGKFLETIGTWDPRAGEGKLVLDRVRYTHWVKLGAQPSELVEKLTKRFPADTAAPAAAPRRAPSAGRASSLDHDLTRVRTPAAARVPGGGRAAP